MKDIEELLPRVAEVAAGCPDPTAIRHLRDAAIEFCRRTRIWRSTESWALTTDDYEIVVVDQEASIYEITRASLDDIYLEPKTIDWLDREDPSWRDDEGAPKWFTQSMPNTVRVTPHPADGGTLTLEMILIPSIDTERIPDELVDTYSRTIADGALARILMLPSGFQDLNLALAHGAKFDLEIGRWADRVPKGQQKARRAVKARFV